MLPQKKIINKLFYIILFIFISNIIYAEQYEITVYNSNIALIKDIKQVSFNKKGIIDYNFEPVAERIIPTSVLFKSDNSKIIEQNYQFDLVDYNKLLKKYIDKQIELVRYNKNGDIIEKKNGILLSVEDGRPSVMKIENKIELKPEGKIILPELPEGLLTKPTLKLKLNCFEKNNNIELSYLTKGLKWNADYVVVLRKSGLLDINGWVTLTNRSGMSFKNAKLNLVAGDINLVESKKRPRYINRYKKYALASNLSNDMAEQQFFEYHLYKLNRKTEIKNNETKQVSLLSAEKIGFDKFYQYDITSNIYNNKKKSPDVVIQVENTKKNNLGMALPKGKIRVYKPDNIGQLQFVGENIVEHIPENDKFEFVIGKSFDIKCKTELVETKRNRNSENKTYRVTVNNFKKEDIKIKLVHKGLYNNWEIRKNNFDYSKVSSQKIIFNVSVKKNNKIVLEYTVYRWWPYR